jgi:hypothetical protein
MPDNVCQRCDAPLQPSEYTWCVPCTECVWRDIWPGVRDVINGALPAERSTLASVVAWAAGLLSELPANILAAVADRVSAQSRWWCKTPVDGLASLTPLRHQVKAATEVWRAWAAFQEELKRRSHTRGLADKYFRPQASRLSSVNQPVMLTRNAFSSPRPTQLACI